jgi:hypothetical protein
MCAIVALENGVVVGEAVEAEAMQTKDALNKKDVSRALNLAPLNYH